MDKRRQRLRLSAYSRWRIYSTFLTGVLIGLLCAFLTSDKLAALLADLTQNYPWLALFDQRTLVLAFFGLLGGVIYSIVVDGHIEMPRFTNQDGDQLEAGLFGDILLGISGAFVLDFLTSPIGLTAEDRRTIWENAPMATSAAKGIIGGYGGKAILVFALEKVFKNIDRLEKEKEKYAEESFQQKLSSIETVQLLDRLNEQLRMGLPDAELMTLQQDIRAASAKVKQQVFNLAGDSRSVGHLSEATRPRVGRAIPVFEALRDSEPQNPQYYAQLAYAYKDLASPDYLQALQYINKAIALRGEQASEKSWKYELNRAIILIQQGYAEKHSLVLPPATQDQVVADLVAVSRRYSLSNILQDAKQKRIPVPVVDWMTANQTELEKRDDTRDLIIQIREQTRIEKDEEAQTTEVSRTQTVTHSEENAAGETTAVVSTTQTTSVTISDAIPQAAIELIKEFEGYQGKAYADPIHGWKVPTIGYGTTRYPEGRPVEQGEVIAKDDAERYLRHELEQTCRPRLEKIPTWLQMNQNQRSALYSFAYNLGPAFYQGEDFDSITRVCDAPNRWSDRSWIQEQFVKYRNPGTSAEAGLRRRRLAEAELFCKPTDQPSGLSVLDSGNLLTGQRGSVLERFVAQKLAYSPDSIADDKTLAKEIQQVLIDLDLLDPPADGLFGPISTAALFSFQSVMVQKHGDLKDEQGFLGYQTAQLLLNVSPGDFPKPVMQLGSDLASRIIKYMKSKNYKIFTRPKEYNIVYVEGMNPDGTLNDDAPNHFNDLRMVIEFENGRPKIVGCWDGTTEPGSHYTRHAVSAKGAARIKFGQYKSWRVDQHCGGSGNCHEALVQFGDVTVHRDANKDMQRTSDRLDTGRFWINQHWGFDYPRNNISYASAGCLVGRTKAGHREFMAIVKQDKRYQQNKQYLFYTTIIPGDEMK